MPPLDRVVFFLLPAIFGGLFVFAAARGLITGKAHGRGGYILKSENPVLYRLTILTSGIGGAAFILWGLGILFGLVPLGPPVKP